MKDQNEGKKGKGLGKLAGLGLILGLGTLAYQVHKFTSDANSLEFIVWPKLLDRTNGLANFQANADGLISIPLTLLVNNRTSSEFDISNLVIDFYHLEKMVGTISHEGFKVPGFTKTTTELNLLVHQDNLNLRDIGSAFLNGGLRNILSMTGNLQANVKLPVLSWRIPFTINDTITWQA